MTETLRKNVYIYILTNMYIYILTLSAFLFVNVKNVLSQQQDI